MENQNSVLSVGQLFSQAWGTFKNKWKVFIPIMILPFAVSILSLIYSKKANFDNPEQVLAWMSANTKLVIGSIFISLIIIVINSWAQLAAFYVVKNLVEDKRDISVKEAYSISLKNLLSYWWVMFLMILIVLGGFILLIIPGIIFSLWYSFAPFVMISENLKGKNALDKSKEYVKGRLWIVFWRTFAIGIIMIVASIIYTAVLGSFLAEVVNNFLLVPVVLLYSFFLYQSLKATVGTPVPAAAVPTDSTTPSVQ